MAAKCMGLFPESSSIWSKLAPYAERTWRQSRNPPFAASWEAWYLGRAISSLTSAPLSNMARATLALPLAQAACSAVLFVFYQRHGKNFEKQKRPFLCCLFCECGSFDCKVEWIVFLWHFLTSFLLFGSAPLFRSIIHIFSFSLAVSQANWKTGTPSLLTLFTSAPFIRTMSIHFSCRWVSLIQKKRTPKKEYCEFNALYVCSFIFYK